MNAILYVAPLFIVLAILDWKWGREQGRQWSGETYKRNVGYAIFAFMSQLLYKPAYLFFYHWLEGNFAPLHMDAKSPLVIIFGLLASDFIFYVWHRLSHHHPFLWGGHAIHHTSQDYNLGLTFRLSMVGPFYMLLMHTPLAFIGVPTEVLAGGLILSTLWQSWLHTEMIKKVPILEWVFVTPASHAVHHATNEIYEGKNFGATLCVWDRLFGTHQMPIASEPVRFTQAVDRTKQSVLQANFFFYQKMFQRKQKTHAPDLKTI